MIDIVIFGYGYYGTILAKRIKDDPRYNLIGFADNSKYKQGNYTYGHKIMSIKEVSDIKGVSVIIASIQHYNEIIKECIEYNVRIEGVFLDNRIKKYPWATFEKLDLSKDITLYAGDINDDVHLNNDNLFGLSITQNDDKHIAHDVTKPYPLPNACIASYESECVFELIGEENVLPALNEIYRILRPGGKLRLSVPDYYSPFLKNRAMTDKNGKILYDAGETYAIKYGKTGLIGGSIWYTNYDVLKEKIEKTKFKYVDWLCYHSMDGILHKKEIDLSKGYLHRVNNESSKDVYCIVVDLYKDKYE
ncbi:Predicted SAM-depedendent methyltransferase [Butyrivibrio fibrisolvens DSM 3071]|uniref:Predicted SAM-depedendent methyltransferase n=1 Tax=Butyrivibrio fibrisolvens DSM 3071 TaxID=1121131 RepID=A0A1M5YYU6_BUTFI|nr:hypothetical protein [Butyrivibrio fibrisolvens]SHI16988.1 Predicted SAM-depedendent methyltransferase [Butyrivibrio fibrisolvens DSM 3071]